MKSYEERVSIGSIAAGGAGVARSRDGRVLFVQRTAPGDVALVRVAPSRKRWASADLIDLVEAGSDRRDPPCPHYARCGGCTIEHLTYDAQLRAKGDIVREALRRIGGLDVAQPDVTPSPSEFRYRNRVSFTLRRLPDHAVIAGFHEIGRADRIVDITEACLLPEQSVADVWGRIRGAWGDWASRLPSGAELRLTLRTTARGDASLLIEGGFGSGQPDVLMQLVPQLKSVWHKSANSDIAILIGGQDALDEEWGDEHIRVGGSLFLQVNRSAAHLLEDYVMKIAGDVRDTRIVDAYCGVALHARRLAARGANVTGIELDPHAAAEGNRAGIRVLEGTVEDVLPSTLPADLVILNPPRGGVDPRVISALVATPPSRIIYVSCDPATLARDLGRLRDVFALQSLQCFDLFPQTTHVETVVELKCSTM